MSGLRLTLGWVAAAVRGRLVSGGTEREIANVLTDSRAIEPGDFFVALRGPRFDGHAFVADVLARGAAGALVERGFAASTERDAEPDSRTGAAGQARQETDGRAGLAFQPGHRGLIEVDDTLVGLQQLAHAVRAAAGTRVVAITGSAGKTTTKEAIAEFLSTRQRVVRNKGNLNNHIGLPLSLMQLRSRPDVAVMELGMNHAGEISTLVAIAEPDVRVWTNVGDAHLGFFASPDAIADAKAEILEGADRKTVLICNADDPRIARRVHGFVGRTVLFGTAEGATVRARDIHDRGIDGIEARVVTPAGECLLQTPLLGRGNLDNVLAACAVALEFDVPLDTIVATAQRLQPAERRGAVRRLRDGIVVIDDSYNSSPAALRRALDVVASESRVDGKVAVLGEMLELGDHAIALHAECGRAAAAAGLRLLYAVGGPAARALADAAVAAGLPALHVIHVETSDRAADDVVRAIRAGDLVLVKGSRGTRTDVVVDRLVAELA